MLLKPVVELVDGAELAASLGDRGHGAGECRSVVAGTHLADLTLVTEQLDKLNKAIGRLACGAVGDDADDDDNGDDVVGVCNDGDDDNLDYLIFKI